jgi:hypothetical protein
LTGLELDRPRDLGDLVTLSFNLFTRHFTPLFTLATIVVAPYVILIDGVWGRALVEGAKADTGNGPTAAYVLVGFLVVQPLMAATVVRFLRELQSGRELSAGEALRAGVEVVVPAGAAVLIAAAGIAAGALAFVIPGIWLAVRWAFVAQAVVADGARGVGALRASAALVDGAWWATCGRLIVLNLVGGAIALVTGIPAAVVDGGVAFVVLTTIGTAASVAYTAVAVTVLYFDRRARAATSAASPV